MPTFTSTGEIDPFLHVSMARGEKIYCESGAMVMMDSTLELKGKMTGGIGSAIMRRFANGESLFQQHIEATGGDGDCLLSPGMPGAHEFLKTFIRWSTFCEKYQSHHCELAAQIVRAVAERNRV